MEIIVGKSNELEKNLQVFTVIYGFYLIINLHNIIFAIVVKFQVTLFYFPLCPSQTEEGAR